MKKIKKKKNTQEKFTEQMEIEKLKRPSKTKVSIVFVLLVIITITLLVCVGLFIWHGQSLNNRQITIYFISLVVAFLGLKYLVNLFQKWTGS